MSYLDDVATATGTYAKFWDVETEHQKGDGGALHIRIDDDGKSITGGHDYDVYRNRGLRLIAIVDRLPDGPVRMHIFDLQTMEPITSKNIADSH